MSSNLNDETQSYSTSQQQDASTTTVAGELENKVAPVVPEDPRVDYGMKAWLAVFGGVLSTISTVGFVSSWGTFQAYYQSTLLTDSSPSTIAWIGSYSLLLLPGFAFGRLYDMGHYRGLYFICSAGMVLSIFLTAECHKYWHFLLCQGFLTGITGGGMSAPLFSATQEWFDKRRGFAISIVAAGGSIGGLIFPIVIRNLIPTVGFPWSMRILGFIILGLLGVSNLCISRRLPPKPITNSIFSISVFKNTAFTIYCVSGFLLFLGLYTVLTFLESSALAHGIPDSYAFYLVSIANGSSFVGRYMAGYLSDKVGPMNVMMGFSAAVAAMTYAWPFAHSSASLTAVAVIYGYVSGAFVALFTIPVIKMGEISDLGRRIGIFMTIFGLGALCGPPISGAILGRDVHFVDVGVYAGSVTIVGIVLMAISRHIVLGGWKGKF